MVVGFNLSVPNQTEQRNIFAAAKQIQNNPEAQLNAAKQAADADGNVTFTEQNIINFIKDNPGTIDGAEIREDRIFFPAVDRGNVPAQPIQLIPEPQTGNIQQQRQKFSQDFGLTGNSYARAGNSKLNSLLKGYAQVIDANQGMRQSIIDSAVSRVTPVQIEAPGGEYMQTYAQNRAIQFLDDVLDKANSGKALNRDDIENIQLFFAKDTNMGDSLKYPGEDNGIDGKFGFRTYSVISSFMDNIQGK